MLFTASVNQATCRSTPTLSVGLMDGRTVSVALAWFPRLLDATPAQRARSRGAGYDIH